MLNVWIKEVVRKTNNYSFQVIEVTEKIKPDNSIYEYLGLEILSSYRSTKFIKKNLANDSDEQIKDYCNKYVFPTEYEDCPSGEKSIRKIVRSGDFGEILSTLLIKKFRDLEVPMNKLRWKFNNGRSVFCTDILSHNKGDKITDLKYYEVKTRTTIQKEQIKKGLPSYYIPYVAYQSLNKDTKTPFEHIIDFLQRLYFEHAEILELEGNKEKSDFYYDISMQYHDIILKSKEYSRSFEIVLIIEKSEFKEVILTELESFSPLELNQIQVTIILLDNIKEITQKSYEYALSKAVETVRGNNNGKT